MSCALNINAAEVNLAKPRRSTTKTGGVRKVRWAGQGRGKRGGTRVIYFFHDHDTPIHLLLVYAKAVREDIAPEAKKAVREIAARIKQAQRRPAERRTR